MTSPLTPHGPENLRFERCNRKGETSMRLGFIGTGSITTALVTGFCTCPGASEEIILSPRNPAKAAELAKAFPQVRVATSNQQVLDKSDWVFLAVVPQEAQEIMAPLVFREDHKVLSLLSGTKVDEVAQWLPAACRPVRLLPMPFVARRIGPILVYPQAQEASDLLASLGKVISVETEHKFEMIAAITALMAPHFGLLHHVVEWAHSAGLDRAEATDYTASMFGALAVLAQEWEGESLEDLMKESMTPGGLNELATKVIEEQEGFAPWTNALIAVQERLTK